MFQNSDLPTEKGSASADSGAALGSVRGWAALPAGLRPTKNGLTTRDFTLDNSKDLYPAGQIFERSLNEELAACAPGQPLVVVMSECHTMPAHLMAQNIALSHVAAAARDAEPARPALFSYEMPYNILAQSARDYYDLSDIPETSFYAVGHDPDGRLALNAILAKNTTPFAPRSLERVYQSALVHDLPTLFNDCARISNKINPGDPLLPEFERELQRDLQAAQRSLNMASPYGMALRNLSMARRAFNHAVIENSAASPIIIQACGTNHVFGNSVTGYKIQHSMTARYEEMGARVLPVFIATEGDNITPEKVVLGGAGSDIWTKHFPNTLILRGLSEAVHTRNTNEAEFLKELEEAYGQSAGLSLKAPFDRSNFPPLPGYEETKEEIRLAFGL